MKNGIIHTTRTQINEFKSLLLESLYTQTEMIIDMRKGIARKIIRSINISSIKSAIVFPPLMLLDYDFLITFSTHFMDAFFIHPYGNSCFKSITTSLTTFSILLAIAFFSSFLCLIL